MRWRRRRPGSFAARGIDRVGKGIRGAPRDALIAELTPAPVRGAAFGLRQTLDTVGAFAGPLIAIALMAATADSFRTVFWLAAIPAALSVIVLVLFVREPRRDESRRAVRRPRLATLLGTLGARFWWLVLVAALFTLARFSEAFLILKAADVGLGLGYVPAVLVVMNVAYALSAYPAGRLSDRVNRWGVLARRRGALDRGRSRARVRCFDLRVSASALRCGDCTWASRRACSRRSSRTAARAEQRGTAFGVFNLVTGLALLVASVLAGVLWDRGGPQLTFLAGAALTAVACVVALALYALKKIDGRSGAAA